MMQEVADIPRMLTQDQARAVCDIDAKRSVCVSAAGTGKTTILTERVRHLLQSGVSPYGIMLVTFTRLAAAEMLSRIRCDNTDVQGVFVGTLHSLALAIVRRDHQRIGYLNEPSVATQSVFDGVVLDVCTSLGYRTKNGWTRITKKQIDAGFQTLYSTGHGPSIVNANPKQIKDITAVESIVCEVTKRLRDQSLCSYGQLMVDAKMLLDYFPDVLDAWNSKLDHILVDEAQDCDQLQWSLVELLRGDDAHLFAVGDQAQSIYAWRGADPKGLEDFTGSCKSENVHHCFESFRCNDLICEASNKVRADGLKMEYGGAPIAQPVLMTISDSNEDMPYQSIVDHALELMDRGGVEPDDIAVLARTHKQLFAIHHAFGQTIKSHHVGNVYSIADDPSFQDVFAIMSLVVNKRNDIAFLRFAKCVDLTEADIGAIRHRAKRDECSLWDAFYEDQYPNADSWALSIEHLLPASGAYEIFSEICNHQPLVNPSDSVRNFFNRHVMSMTIKGFLDWFAFREASEDVAPEGHVTLSTVHAAKGLEWRAVIIANCDDRNFGGAIPSRDAEEQRRVLYVAMTRASEFLYLHCRSDADTGLALELVG